MKSWNYPERRFDFGKYNGLLVSTVCKQDPSYLAWAAKKIPVVMSMLTNEEIQILGISRKPVYIPYYENEEDDDSWAGLTDDDMRED